MAERAYTAKEITIGEGSEEFEITIRTNTIKRQRQFMKQWEANGKEVDVQREKYEAAIEKAKDSGKEVDEAEFEVDALDGYISLCGIALQRALEHKVENQFQANGKLTKEYREFLEDNLDQETIYEVIEVCGGINLPEMFRMMQEIQANQLSQEQVGQNSE